MMAPTMPPAAPSTASASAPKSPRSLLLTGAKVLDSGGDRWTTGHDVLLREGRIERLAPSQGAATHADARTIDLTGRFLIPGLIDLHTHLLLRPYTAISWDDQILRDSLERRTLHGAASARATLEAGFTTVRDLGTEGAGLADIALRDAIAEGTMPGPRVFAATRAIVATGCYGPWILEPRWQGPGAAQAADGADGVRRAVREQAGAGADWIKVYADGRRGRGAPVTPTFSQDELDALVDEARSAGLAVAAHATTDEGIRRAVSAGVTTIEHGYGATESSLSMMTGAGVVFCPTLATAEAIAVGGGWDLAGGEPEPASLRGAKETFARALRIGVGVACGSDAGVFPHGDNAREIELMAACGMTAAEALRAATSHAARVLGRGFDPSAPPSTASAPASVGDAGGGGGARGTGRARLPFGTIAEGCAADLVALDGDPLLDLTVLRRPFLVVKDGRIALGA
jgi:imidazolonepropionase-like amidohydrolase